MGSCWWHCWHVFWHNGVQHPTPVRGMAHVFCYSSWWEDTFSILLVGTTCMKSSLLKSTQFCLDPAVGPTSLCLNAFNSVGQPSTRQTLLHWMMLGLLNHCYSNLDQKLATLVLFQVFHVRWHFKFILTTRRLQRDDRISNAISGTFWFWVSHYQMTPSSITSGCLEHITWSDGWLK